MLELPPKTERRLEVVPNEEEKAAYTRLEAIARRRAAELLRGPKPTSKMLSLHALMLPLRQACSGGAIQTDIAQAGTERRCEHFAEYGSAAHALSYFRGNENIPAVCNPILAALLKEEAVTSLGENLHWKLTLNDYKASTEDALAEAGGALFPWHTDLAANGEITAISTLLAPAIMEFAPHADLAANEKPTRIVAKPGTLVLLSGDARWKWVHRAMPHPEAAGKARISLVLGCAASAF